MKNCIKLFSIILLAVSVMSCETTDDCIYLDKRYCDPNFVKPDIEEGIVELDQPIENYDRKILLEDFTGFKCANCPPATVTAVNLKSENPDRMSIIGVHCTFIFAAPSTADTTQPFHTDFRTPEGNTIEETFNLQSLPNGSINRNGVTAFGNWDQVVNAELANNNPEVFISIEDVVVNEQNGTITAHVYAKPLVSQDKPYIINMSVVENGIPEAQKDNDVEGGTIYDYTHNHVFRGSAYGAWGIPAFNGDIDLRSNQAIYYKLTMDINPIWKLENCELMVFISNTDRTVVQIEETHLIE